MEGEEEEGGGVSSRQTSVCVCVLLSHIFVGFWLLFNGARARTNIEREARIYESPRWMIN